MIMLMKNILKIFSYLKGEYGRLAIVTLFNISIGLIIAVIPIFYERLIDSIIKVLNQPNPHISILYPSIIGIAALLFSADLISFFNSKVSDTLRIQISTKLRLLIFPKILNLSTNYIERHRPGSVLTKVNQATGDFVNWAWNLNDWIGTTITSTIFILIIIWTKSVVIGLLFTIVLPILIYIRIRNIRESKPARVLANKSQERYSGYLSEVISNLTMIKTLSSEKKTTQNLRQYANAIKTNRLKQFKYDQKYRLIGGVVSSVAIIAALVISSYLAINKVLSPGVVFLIAFYVRNLVNSTYPLGRFIQDTSDTDISSGRLVEFLETKPDFTDKPGAEDLAKLENIDLKNVTYDYKDGKKGAVKNICLTINAGKTVALVGPSGVGKSTLTKLLLRFYEPTSGKITINGQDVSHYTAESIRRHVGMVMQDVALFNSTIMENLQIANASATERQIVLAAKQAHADEFIRQLPKGYKTLVGERGVKLSGGQKQRIAIARAILKNPQLIILDEATSALDSQSERLVQDGLEKLMTGRSALIIAHRLSTVMHADEILVLQKGTIVERGTHAQLIKYNGLYKKLFDMQSASGKVRL